MPKISIIVPIYNVEKYLEKCIDSIINQTLKDIEIICIDDGSTDKSGKILDDYAALDNRIKVIHKENGGYGKAMNIGLDNATGEYIGIVEPDDYITSKMYEDLYQIAITNDSDIVKSSFYVNRKSPQETRTFKNFGWDSIVPKTTFKLEDCPNFLCSHPSIWSAIYKREFINSNKIRFIEAPGAGWTDNPFYLKAMYLANKINYTSNAYYYWLQEAANDSDALKNYKLPFDRANDIYNILKEHNITNPRIIEAIYKTQITHIKIVLGVKKLNLFDCIIKINKLCNKMDFEIIKTSKLLNKEDIQIYKLGKYCPVILLIKHRFLKNVCIYKREQTKKRLNVWVLGIKFSFKLKQNKNIQKIEALENQLTKIEKEIKILREKVNAKS